MLPDHVAATATQTWGEAGRAWVARFPETLGWVCTQWGLTDLRPFPDLSYHFVARALCARGPVVLKLGVPNQELACEAATLAAFQGRGCVPLLRVDLADGALLLEDLSPARSLAELWSPGTDAEQTGLLGTAMAKLWRDPPDWRMPTTGDWSEALRHPAVVASGEIPGELLEEAARMWEALEASMLRRVLLHGDLHHGNLLTGPHGPTVIDPMGVMGDPAFEVYPLLVNPRHAPPEDRVRLLDSRLAIVEAVTGLPLDRLRGWGFCGAVLSACWDAMDGNPPEPGSLAVAEALRRGSP